MVCRLNSCASIVADCRAVNASSVHRQYLRNPPLERAAMAADPLVELRRWVDSAVAAGLTDPVGMVLATADVRGRPSARVVLLRGVDQGLSFYTDYGSRKGRELAANAQAAATFWWPQLERCVRVEGRVEKLSRAESRAYFSDRPRGSQLAAVASLQSQPIESREALEARMAETARHYEGSDVECPERWGGYRLVPERVEFWQGRDNRAHDRLVYLRVGDSWRVERLQP